MSKLFNLKIFTVGGLLALMLASTLGIGLAPSAVEAKGKKDNAPGQNKVKTDAPGKNKKACKSNNGIGNNYDIEVTLPNNEVVTIRIDPGNKGQMNKFAGYLATEKNIDATVFDTVIKPQIIDAEMRANSGNGDCTSSSSSSVSTNTDFTADSSTGTPVSVEMVLSVDVSWSVDDSEFNLQHQGYINAFKDNEIRSAIKKLPNGLAVNMQFWANKEVIDTGWYKLTNDTQIDNFISKLEDVERDRGSYGRDNKLKIDDDSEFGSYTQMGFGTDIEKAIKEATKLITENDYDGKALVIDVSGDGISTDTPYNGQGKKRLGYWPNTRRVCGVQLFCPPVKTARDAAVAEGITINGLPINGPKSSNSSLPDYYADQIDDFYRDYVIGGEDAFVEIANGFDSFNVAAKKKILREIEEAGNLKAEAVNDAFATDEDTSTTGNVITNDLNPEQAILTVAKVNGVATNNGQQFNLPSGALLTVNSNGSFTYNPNSRFEDLNDGEQKLDSFTYTLSDGTNVSSATVSMNVAGVTDYTPPANNDPNAANDNDVAGRGKLRTIDVLANDGDPDGDTLTIDSISKGTSAADKIGIDPNGEIEYTPSNSLDYYNPGETFYEDTFSYTVSDGKGGSDTANVTVKVYRNLYDPELPEDIRVYAD